MPTTSSSPKRLGTFVLPSGESIDGELTLKGSKTTLYLHNNKTFLAEVPGAIDITGVLHDLTKVSLIQCIRRRAIDGGSENERYYQAELFPHFVLAGDVHVAAAEKAIVGVDFRIDDATTLFYDFDAFGLLLDSPPVFNQLGRVRSKELGRTIVMGSDAQVGYFTGKHEIVAADTVFGRISASHNPLFAFPGPHGVSFKNRIYVSIDSPHGIEFRTAIERTYRLADYLGLLIGRPQKLQSLHFRVRAASDSLAGLKVYCSMPSGRRALAEIKKPHAIDRLMDPVGKPEAFAQVLKRWLDREEDWREARWRFFELFAHQRFYPIDRLIAAANMFDILPDSAVPSDMPLTDAQKKAQSTARSLFLELPQSPERNSVLGALGRMGKSALKHKIRHRAQLLLGSVGSRFPELSLVTDEAVNCRNYFVHGSEPTFDYKRNSDLLTFFTNTLEFVFATSDLIDSGWDANAWAAAPTSLSHPFAGYRMSYAEGLRILKAALRESRAAQASD